MRRRADAGGGEHEFARPAPRERDQLAHTYFTGSEGCTTKVFGLVAMRPIAVKSLIGSYGSFA